jgi:hypothetical protein
MLMAVDSAQGSQRAAFGSPPVVFEVIADSQATASLRSARQQPPRLPPNEAEHRHPVIAAQSPRVLPLLGTTQQDQFHRWLSGLLRNSLARVCKTSCRIFCCSLNTMGSVGGPSFAF